jgi:AcrR family transcriptional regulator
MPRGVTARGAASRLRLLEAATRLLDAGGRDAVLTLRSVAREAGLAAPSVYWHYDDLEQIVLDVVRVHAEELAAVLAQAAARGAPGGPAGELRAMALAYCRWGLASPGAYMVVADAVAVRALPAAEESARTGGGALVADLAARVARLPDPPEDPRLAATGLWASRHGVVSLRLARPAYRWPALARQVDQALRAVVR